MTLQALVLSCSLRRSPSPSSSELLGREVLTALADHDVDGTVIRVADHDVRFGVSADEGDGDAWPAIRDRLLQTQILRRTRRELLLVQHETDRAVKVPAPPVERTDERTDPTPP